MHVAPPVPHRNPALLVGIGKIDIVAADPSVVGRHNDIVDFANNAKTIANFLRTNVKSIETRRIQRNFDMGTHGRFVRYNIPVI